VLIREELATDMKARCGGCATQLKLQGRFYVFMRAQTHTKCIMD
jgi:hypothetical protein